jgi:hypothetical protein
MPPYPEPAQSSTGAIRRTLRRASPERARSPGASKTIFVPLHSRKGELDEGVALGERANPKLLIREVGDASRQQGGQQVHARERKAADLAGKHAPKAGPVAAHDVRTDPVQSAPRLLAGEPMLAAAETCEHRISLEDCDRPKIELCARTHRGEVDRLDARDCRARSANQAGC